MAPFAERCYPDARFRLDRAEQAGRIHAILAEDGAMVEAGQPLYAMVAL